MPGFVHTYIGAEAVAVGVCAHLGDDDLITSTHRGHGHCLAKGVPVAGMVAELYGRETGLCKGRGGSMHVADFSRGMLGANAIVGGGISLAVGGALAADTLGDGRVAVTFFGDGASNQGIFHESLNLAAIWRLPVVFVCENNGWAESTPASYAVAVTDVAARAVAYAIPGVTVDASDVEEVWSAAGDAVERAGGARDRHCSRPASAGSAGTTSAIPRTTAAATTGVPLARPTRSPVCASAWRTGCRRGGDRRRGRVGGGGRSRRRVRCRPAGAVAGSEGGRARCLRRLRHRRPSPSGRSSTPCGARWRTPCAPTPGRRARRGHRRRRRPGPAAGGGDGWHVRRHPWAARGVRPEACA